MGVSMPTIVPRKGTTGKRTWQAQIRKKGYPRQTKTFDRKTDAIKMVTSKFG
jgi:hypothetical protein